MTKLKRRHRPGRGVHDWLVETAPDIPRSDLPKPFLGGRVRLRWVRWAVGSTLFLVPLLALALVVNLASSPDPDQTTTARRSATEPTAAAAVVTWLEQVPAPIPGGGQILTWDGETAMVSATTEPGQAPPPDLSSHTFTVLAGSGQLFSVGVVTATSPTLGTVTVGDPSLIALPPAETSIGTVDAWPHLEPTSPTGSIRTAITTWAKAYTSGDPSVLLQSTGDPDTSHAYMPLTGAAFTEVSATEAGAVWGDADRSTVDGPPAMVVRVDARLYWLRSGETQPPSGLPADKTAPVAFDVLVQRADTASPVVVAWGAAGSGERLVAFTNAIVGRNLVASTTEPSAAVSTTASSAATPTGSASRGGGR